MTTAITTTHLHDVIDSHVLGEMLAAGYVRQQTHPVEPLTILNYTERAAAAGVWNHVTRRCRGLIYNHETYEVLARPMPKFFNYGQAGAPVIDIHEPVVVTDKADGSLGILFPTRDGWSVATRGSFASEQAIHATGLLRARYAGYVPPRGLTVLVEIVYPANRIVIDYGALDDLVLLGAVDIATGRSLPPDAPELADWPGPRTQVFGATLATALAAPGRSNAEGYVVHCPRTDERVKIKYDEYVRLHRIVTGLNARVVWQHLVDGKPLAELIEPLPDEFHLWVLEVAARIVDTVQAELLRLREECVKACVAMPDGWLPADRADRAMFARSIAGHPDKWALFSILDGKDIRPKLLFDAKPEPASPSGRTYTEDTN